MKKLYINVPFLDAIQVPTYARYIKEILQNKKSLAVEEVVKMTEECTAAITDTTPEKKPDPGSPSIRCLIGTHMFERALYDLGASVSVMPRYIFTSLNLLDLEPTAMCLELADHSVRYPDGIAEDVPVHIGDHIVPIDFIVLDMDRRTKTPLILG
uniref:Aspartic peptidase DDI1-type domain-containing protein n=1 Tax=Arundo donax TaxID=35708 RepID=A0A0A9AXN6_ARUDO